MPHATGINFSCVLLIFEALRHLYL